MKRRMVMQDAQNNATSNEYRSIPISILVESATNPRKRFDEKNLEELAASMRFFCRATSHKKCPSKERVRGIELGDVGSRTGRKNQRPPRTSLDQSSLSGNLIFGQISTTLGADHTRTASQRSRVP